MYTTHLRKVGGSIMLAVPPAILELLSLKPGAPVAIAVEGGQLVVRPCSRPRYTLDELLAQCEPSAPRTAEDQEWLDLPPLGEEIL